jgi:hypothetical protein
MDKIMNIKLCEDKDLENFHNFVMAQPNSLIYHTKKYMTLIRNHLGCDFHYYLLENDGAIEAILTGMSKDGKYGKVFNSLPFYGSNGGILASNKSAYKAMLYYYNELIKNMSFATFIENPFEISQRKPDSNLTSDRICQVSDIGQMNLENLEGNFTSKKRNDIRRALRNRVEVQIDFSDQAKAYLVNTHIANMKAVAAVNKSKEYFNDLFSLFDAGIDFDLFTAKKDGEFVAALLLLYHKNIVEYYTPVISSNKRHLQALSLIIYEAMKRNKTAGRVIWNWGGNGNSLDSVYRFKKNWLASDFPYKYFIKSNIQRLTEIDQKEILREYCGFYLFPFEQNNSLNNRKELY